MRKTFSLIAALALFALTVSTQADTYLTIDGIKGDSTAVGHANAINVLRFNLDLESTIHETGGLGGAVGKPVLKPLIITRNIDDISPQFLKALTSSEHLKTVTLELFKPGGGGKESAYYTLKLTSAFISGVHQYTDPQTNANLEDISISYEKIEAEASGSSTPAKTDNPTLKIPGGLRPPNK